MLERSRNAYKCVHERYNSLRLEVKSLTEETRALKSDNRALRTIYVAERKARVQAQQTTLVVTIILCVVMLCAAALCVTATALAPDEFRNFVTPLWYRAHYHANNGFHVIRAEVVKFTAWAIQ